MKSFYMGIDVAQVQNGISVLDEDSNVVLCTNTSTEMPKSNHGKNVPDFIKNRYQSNFLEKLIDDLSKKGKIKMVVLEGPNYSSSSNVTQISIGSIHGVFWDLLMRKKLNFAIVTPLSVNYFIFGTAKDISKRSTMNKMKEKFNLSKMRDSNCADSLAMSFLAKQFDTLLTRGEDSFLEKQERAILTSKAKYKGEPKGLVFKENIKYYLFDKTNYNWRF